MPKSKRGPALFELYAKGRSDDPPQASGKQGGASGRSPLGESASAFKATLSSLAKSIGGGDTPKAEADEPQPVSGRRSSVQVEGGRVHVALSSRGAGLVGFVALLLACVAFAAGQWLGRQGGLADGRKQARESMQRTAVDEIELARSSRPAEGLFEGIGTSPIVGRSKAEPVAALAAAPTPRTAGRTVQTPWVKGHTYVVVQSFRGDARQDAIRAQEFLAQHGIETGVFGSGARGFRLIAANGFNRKDAAQRKLADRFLKKVRNIGKAYFKAGGRYKLEGYFATLKSDTW